MLQPPPCEPPAAPSRAYAYYVVMVLALVYLASSIDRTMVSTVAEPLKHEFHLSDSEIGIVTGLVFSLSFTLFGVPLGFMVDRLNRSRLLALLVVIWSGLTFVSGIVHSYAALVAARAGVGASEAGVSPNSMSLITDYFPPEGRGKALAFFYVSTPIGVAAGLAAGGFLAGNYGWRAAFLVAGVPGFLLAGLLLATVKEPKRGAAELQPVAEARPRPSLGALLAILGANPPLVLLICAGVCVVVSQAGLGAFNTPFLMRIHGVPIASAGYALSAAHLLPGVAGVLFGGFLADRMARRSPWGSAVAVAFLMAAAAPVAIAAYLVSDWHLAVLLLALHLFLNATYYGTLFSTYMTMAPIEMRGTLGGLLSVVMTLMGYGLGPVVSGLSSDLYANAGFHEPLRWAQVTVSLGFFVAASCFFATAVAIRKQQARKTVAG